jgi:hypothetical protein
MGIWELFLWMFASVIKFLVTPSLMIARGWGFGITVAVSSVGAALGVLIFFYFGKWLLKKWSEFRGEKEPKRPFFTEKKRRIVRFRRRFGIWGLLIVSGFISVPIAAVLAAKYYQRDERMPWILIGAFFIWSLMLTALTHWAVPVG